MFLERFFTAVFGQAKKYAERSTIYIGYQIFILVIKFTIKTKKKHNLVQD
jgi:hypothetical protein